jgi:putative methionine-R-sulfoxide reductase with GAF domain
MKVKFDSKQFGITLFIIYLILIIPLILILIKTGNDLNKLAMNPGFISANEIRDDFPKLFFIIAFSFVIGIITSLSFLFYIKRNKTSIDFDETIELEYWKEDDEKEINYKETNFNPDYKKTNEGNSAEAILKKELITFNENDDVSTKSEQAIKYLCTKMNAGFGVIYLTNKIQDADYLEFSGGYAFFKPKSKSSKILFGEGLTGQVAKSQTTIIIDQLNEGQVTIFSGLGKSSPRSIIIAPIVKDKLTVGVIEIATFQKLTTIDKEMIESAAQLLSNEY